MSAVAPAPDGSAAQPDRRAGNSYDFVRFLAASAVLFSHHFDLSGFREPRVPGYGGDFGQLGVAVFFSLSGFLICLSLQRSRDPLRFALARVLRIGPNLVFVLVVTSAVTFVWFHNDAHIEAHVGYVLRNLLMLVQGVTQTIPGVFENAARRAVNDPLWTLPHELWLYVLLGLLFFCGGRGTRVGIVLLALLFSIAWGAPDSVGDRKVGPLEVSELARLGSYFLSGAIIGLVWPYLRGRAIAIGLAGAAGALLIRTFVPVDTLLLSLAFTAAVIGLGSSKAMAWFSKGGDPSYGMYVFAWPVQQLVIPLVGSFWPALLVAFLVTVAIGYGTWHAFEKRALAYLAPACRSAGYTRSDKSSLA